jgi:DNA-directed RNA polymerase II subunit RPB1
VDNFSQVNQLLNDARDRTGERAQRSLSKYNNFKVMADAGSKGNKINISQVRGLISSQSEQSRKKKKNLIAVTLM